MKAFKRIFAAATLLVTTGLASEVNAQVPLEDFFKNPEKVGYQISPDGKYFSYMAPYENRLNLRTGNRFGQDNPNYFGNST